jgi:hypothetical protein
LVLIGVGIAKDEFVVEGTNSAVASLGAASLGHAVLQTLAVEGVASHAGSADGGVGWRAGGAGEQTALLAFEVFGEEVTVGAGQTAEFVADEASAAAGGADIALKSIQVVALGAG